MGLKMAILIIGIFAMLLLVSSEVPSTNSKEVTNGVDDAKYPGGGYGSGYPGYGGGHHDHDHDHGGYRGGYCRYGCCGGRTYKGGCRRCCYYAAEAVAAQTQDKTHN